MKKTILFVVLSIILLSFLAFYLNVFAKLNEYWQLSDKKVDNRDIVVDSKSNPSTYFGYSRDVYETALKENKVIVLFFTANWCGECLSQDLLNTELLESLGNSGIVGLRIHILDSETTTETGALAKKFDVSKENSIVILDKKGAVYFKQVGTIDMELFKQKINEVGDVKVDTTKEVLDE